MKKIGFACWSRETATSCARADERLSRAEQRDLFPHRRAPAQGRRDRPQSEVNLSFADAGDQKYVSVTGTAVVSNDRAKIKELFTTGQGVVGLGGRSQHPRAEDHRRRRRVLGFAGPVISYVRWPRASHAPGSGHEGDDVDAYRSARGSADQARTTVRAAAGKSAGKSAARDTAADAGARRAPAPGGVAGQTPEELPVRGPQGPRAPNPATASCRVRGPR